MSMTSTAYHALSSQVCCFNFLMTLAEKPVSLGEVVAAALGIAPPEMLPVEKGPDGQPWFVGFEWNGERDYLNEAGRGDLRPRGANSTSADAVLRFRHQGRIEALLIEWKYTESYGPPIPPSGNPTRIARYAKLAFAPDGPIRADPGLALQHFFWEPFYQLLRQQMLAFQMQRHQEGGAERVRVLHVAPAANTRLRKVTSAPLRERRHGDDAFAVFRSFLVNPDDFVSRSTEALFGTLLAGARADDEWRSYLVDRYGFLQGAPIVAKRMHDRPVDRSRPTLEQL
jgi:hypothetical protein